MCEPVQPLPWDFYRRPFTSSFWFGDLRSEDEGEDYFADGADFERIFGFDVDTKLGAVLETSPVELPVPVLLDRLEPLPVAARAAIIESAREIGITSAHAVLCIRHFAYDRRPVPRSAEVRLHFVCWVPMRIDR